jgi:hypothetical protein
MKKLIVCLLLLGAATCLAETFAGEKILSLRDFLGDGFGNKMGIATGRVGMQEGWSEVEYYRLTGYRVYGGCFTGRVALHHFQGFELYEFTLGPNKNYWLALPSVLKGLQLVPACH